MTGFDLSSARISRAVRASNPQPNPLLGVGYAQLGWVRNIVFMQFPSPSCLVSVFHKTNTAYPLSSDLEGAPEEQEEVEVNLDGLENLAVVHPPLLLAEPVSPDLPPLLGFLPFEPDLGPEPPAVVGAFVVRYDHLIKIFDLMKLHDHVSFRYSGPVGEDPLDQHVLARITYDAMLNRLRRDVVHLHVEQLIDAPPSTWVGVIQLDALLLSLSCARLVGIFESFCSLTGLEYVTQLRISPLGIELRWDSFRVLHNLEVVGQIAEEVLLPISSALLLPYLRIYLGGTVSLYGLQDGGLVVVIALPGELSFVTVAFRGL